MPDWDEPFYMFEGSSVRKVNNQYIMAYCRAYPRTGPTAYSSISEIGWAYSDNPFGDPALGSPWIYGGVVVDNRGEQITDPYAGDGTTSYTFTGGNVHGGMVEANGQWYQVYHRDTNIKSKRQAMAEPFDLSFAGEIPAINQVEMTSQGFGENGLDPYKEHFAGIACYIYPPTGNTAPTFFTQTETSLETYDFAPYSTTRVDWYPIERIRNQSWVGYKYFNFEDGVGDGTLKLVLTLKESFAGTINIYANDPKEKYSDPERPKTLIGTIALAGTNSDAHTVEGVVENLTGKKGIYLEFLSTTATATDDICQLNKLQFVKTAAQ
jgi:hypothetical protein